MGLGLGLTCFEVLVAGALRVWWFTGGIFDISIELYLFSLARSLPQHFRQMSSDAWVRVV